MLKNICLAFLALTLIGCGANSVKVVNKSSKPVPVKGRVEITNAPNVIIGNDPSSPLIVSEAYPREPFHSTAWSATSETSDQVVISTEVPSENKMLVVETITVQVQIKKGAGIGKVTVRSNMNGRTIDHNISLTKQGNAKGTDDPRVNFTGTHAVRLYIAPGKKVVFLYEKGKNTGNYNFRSTVSGYLIPEGSPSLAP